MYFSKIIEILLGLHLLGQGDVVLANEAAVFKQVFENYEKNVRPVKNSSHAVVIDFNIEYLYILGVKGAEESITALLDYKLIWTDEYLTWQPTNFSVPVYSLHVLQSLIWQPDIVMDEKIESTSQFPDEQRRVQIDFDGKVTLYNPQLITFTCVFVIDDFPFDKQRCRMGFGPWIYNISQLDIQANNATDITTPKVYDTKEWSIFSFESQVGGFYGTINGEDTDVTRNYPGISYYLTIKRQPVYYIWVSLIPTFIISTLCLLGIFSPSNSRGEREEKVEMGLTTLLTVAVILSIVAAEMPRATTLPLLGYFVLAELSICAVAVLISILIILLHQRLIAYRIRPPNWLRCRLIFKKKIKMNYGDEDSTAKQDNNNEATLVRMSIAEFDKILALIRYRLEKDEFEHNLVLEWNKLFDFIDLVCLVCFQCANIVMTVYLFF